MKKYFSGKKRYQKFFKQWGFPFGLLFIYQK